MSDCATDMAAHSQLNGYMSGIRSGNTTLVKPAGPVLQQPEWHVGEEKSFRGVSFTTNFNLNRMHAVNATSLSQIINNNSITNILDHVNNDFLRFV